MEFLLVKWIHILSSTILFGTGLGSAFYMFMANRRGEIHGMFFATRQVVIADWIFTTPSGIIQLVSGIWLAHLAGYSMSEGWIQWALLLYCFAGACWVPVVWIQIKMRDMVKVSVETGDELDQKYWKLDRLWIGLGTAAFPAVVVIFYLMVFKPDVVAWGL